MPATLPPPPARPPRRRPAAPPASRPAGRHPHARSTTSGQTVATAPVFTLVLWSGVLLIGGLGFAFPYQRPQPPAPEPPPVTAEKISVQLTAAPLPVADTAPVLDPLTAPPPAPPVAVAAPSPALAFALPVPGPVRLVDASRAAGSSVHAPSSAAQPAPVKALVFGRGEGRQPAPPYPSAAVRDGQEGTVTVRFSVGPDGRVLSAQIAASSPWPLLDEAALRTVLNRWRFPPGATRLYEVPIRFTLQK